MLSYKHAFHIGNHADVLKHIAVIAAIGKMTQKTKPFTVIDTHAGAGVYALSDQQVMLNKEYDTGVTQIIDSDENAPPPVQQYIDIVQAYRERGELPGSPAIVQAMLRAQDEHIIMELHPAEAAKLKRCRVLKDAHIHHRDGLEGAIALSPPKIKRGMLLIDPPYEQASEYRQVIKAIQGVHKRWSNACVLLWYPLLSKRAGEKASLSPRMLEQLVDDEIDSAINLRLCVSENSEDVGMYGSGVLVLNAPWQFYETMQDALQFLGSQLACTEASVTWLKQPS